MLTAEKLTGVDFADLYDHPWHPYQVVGFSNVWISRLSGKTISADELEATDQRIRTDLYFDYREDEIDVDLSFIELEDSVLLSVQDHEDLE